MYHPISTFFKFPLQMFKLTLFLFNQDITKACLIEGFQSAAYLQAADRVLKALGKFKASQEYKVGCNTSVF